MDLTVQIIQSIFYLHILSFSLCFYIFFALLEIKNIRLHVYCTTFLLKIFSLIRLVSRQDNLELFQFVKSIILIWLIARLQVMHNSADQVLIKYAHVTPIFLTPFDLYNLDYTAPLNLLNIDVYEWCTQMRGNIMREARFLNCYTDYFIIIQIRKYSYL